jgi:hypothetical protein
VIVEYRPVHAPSAGERVRSASLGALITAMIARIEERERHRDRMLARQIASGLRVP